MRIPLFPISLLIHGIAHLIDRKAEQQVLREEAEAQAAIDRIEIQPICQNPDAGSPMGVVVRQTFPNPHARQPKVTSDGKE